MGPTRTPASTRRSHHMDSVQTVRRPPNTWILYRCDKAKALEQAQATIPSRCQADISKTISAMWSAETPEIRAHYQLSDIKKAEHHVAHSYYRFQPMKKAETERLRAEKPAEKDCERSGRKLKAKMRASASQDLPPLYTNEVRFGPAVPSPASAVSTPPVGEPSSQRLLPIVPQLTPPAHLPTPPNDHSSTLVPPTSRLAPNPAAYLPYLSSINLIPPLTAPQLSLTQRPPSTSDWPQRPQHLQTPPYELGFDPLWLEQDLLPDMSQFISPQVRLFRLLSEKIIYAMQRNI